MDFAISQAAFLFPIEIWALIIWTAVKYGADISSLMKVDRIWQQILTDPMTLLIMPDLKWLTRERLLEILRFRQIPLNQQLKDLLSVVLSPHYFPNSDPISDRDEIANYLTNFYKTYIELSWETLRLPTLRDIMLTNYNYCCIDLRWDAQFRFCKSIAALNT